MRCETSELAFEALLDGTLAPRRRVELDAHLERCDGCRAILEELRVVDALLLVPRELEPAPNFTFKVMAEVRALEAPRAARPFWPLLFTAYIAFSWIAIAVWVSTGRADIGSTARALGGALSHLGGAFDAIAQVAASGFGFGYAGVAGIVTFLLFLDLALLFGVVFLRNVVRPRLAAHLARSQARV